MSYILKYTKQAERHFEKHRRSGIKKMMIKIHQILNELREHPVTGIGKPEQLKRL